MFSLGRIRAKKDGEFIDDNALVDSLKYPNPFQSDKQFLWDYMFWLMGNGNSYFYSSSRLVKDTTNMYWLNPFCLEWTEELVKKLDKISLSKGSVKDIEKLTIKYNHLDGTSTNYSLGEIKPFFELSNGIGNWYKGSSSIDAMYKILRNSNASLDAKYSNLDFSGKFMMFGKNTMDDISQTVMGENEKSSIKSKLKGKESVHVVKSAIDIKRFVENIDKLKLDNAYNEDVFKISKLHGHPKAIIESLETTGVFGEEKKEAKADFVDEVLRPKGDDLMNGLEKYFGYDTLGIDLVLDFSHLSFMNIRNKQKQEANRLEIENIRLSLEMNAIDESTAKERIKQLMGYE